MTEHEIQSAMEAGSLSIADGLALLKEVKAESIPLKLKVSEKGCLSIYGLTSRFPVSLYPNQWERIFAQIDDIRAFIEQHKTEFSVKG
jgi:hypothetical protein